MEKINLKEVAFKQQAAHLAQAQAQALKLLIEGQQPFKLTVNDALSYLELAKMKLDPLQFAEFMQVMGQCKEANCDAVAIISKVCYVLQGHSELIRGFGMFLPPSFNLQLQTSGQFLINAMKNQNSPWLSSVKQEQVEEADVTQSNEAKIEAFVMKSEDSHSQTYDTNAVPSEEKDLDYLKEVDDDYAVLFIGKVKDRFQSEPHVFEKFLELLDSVRKDTMGVQTDIETDVYLEVVELFQNNDDLIEEFKTFVPNAIYMSKPEDTSCTPDVPAPSSPIENVIPCDDTPEDVVTYTSVSDPSIAPVCKYGSLEEHAFFDKVRAAVGHKEVYDNFLRCLMLYNEDVVTRSELSKLAVSFLGKFPDLLKQFKDILGFKESGENIEIVPMRIISYENSRLDPEVALDIDYATGGKNGASYRALPKSQELPKCSGRTPLCKEVLNDTWVSFPSWSEDSTFVTSCKTQYEETIYRCEDERFELDMAIRTNYYTIQVLENVQKRINKMSPEEKSIFALDDTLGGTSTVLHQKALHRLYGDKTDELVEGLKRNPVVAVPIILKRLKGKDEEWKEKQRQFNMIWREQIDNFYLKSLDHQGINFKQNDSKSFRSKSLLNEMEMVYAEKKESRGFHSTSPHFLLEFKDMCVFLDAINLICQYLKKLPGIFREDRRRIEHLVRNFIPDFFGFPRGTVAEEETGVEEEEEEPEEVMDMENECEERSGHTSPSESGVFSRDDGFSDQDESNSVEENELSDETDKNSFIEESDIFDKMDVLLPTNLPYVLFFLNKNWYIFFRQFHILCERLSRLLHESTRKDLTLPQKTVEDGTEDDVNTDTKPTYAELIVKLSQLLSGALDYVQFEDEVRSLFGIHAFVSFTMDKLVLNIVRQLQQIVGDDVCKQCTAFFFQHTKVVAAGGYSSPLETSQIESRYLKKVERVMGDEKCFKVLWHKKDHAITIELIEHEVGDNVEDPCEVEKWSNYLDTYVNEDSVSEDILSYSHVLPVFLPRNLRKQKIYWKGRVTYVENLWKKRYSSSFIKNNSPLLSYKRKASTVLNPLLSKCIRSASIESNDDPISSCSVKIVGESSDSHLKNIEEKVHEQSSLEVDNLLEPLSNESSDIKIVRDEPMDNATDIIFIEIDAEEDCAQIDSGQQTIKKKLEQNASETSELNLNVIIKSEHVDTEHINEIILQDVENAAEPMSIDFNSSSDQIDLASTGSMDILESNEHDASMKSSEVILTSGCAPEVKDVDMDCQIDLAVESPSHVIDTITVNEGETTTVSADVIEKHDKIEEKKSPRRRLNLKRQSQFLRRKINRKPSEYTIRTRKNKINLDYVKRRVRRSNFRSAHSNLNKEKRGKQGSHNKCDILDDVSFDYAYFSELSDDEKCLYLAMKSLFVHDDAEGSFKKDSYKIYFVQHRDTYLIRKDCLTRAKEIHQQVSEIKTSNFNSWHRIWLDRYVTPAMLKFCNDWLLRSDPEKYKLVCMTKGDCAKAPFIPYNIYRVRYYKTET